MTGDGSENHTEERDRPPGIPERGLPQTAAVPRHYLDIDFIALKGRGLLASLVLHLCLVGLALFGLDWVLPAVDPEPLVVNVTLEQLEEPPPEVEESEPTPQDIPEDAASEPAPPSGAVAVESPQEDGAKLISANKSDAAVIRPDHMFFGGSLKQGNEIRWNLRALAAESYTLEDYLGNYRIRGEDRVIRILDGREKYGKLLFHDPQTDTLRALTRFGDKIFTYGPSLEAAEPVVGSITFLPVKHHAESGDVEIPSRILWLPENPPMKFGDMIRFDEREVVVAQGLRGLFTTPPGKGPNPAVVWAADAGCRSHFAYRIVARELALNGVAMLSLDPPECPDPGAEVRPLVTAAHIRQGMEFLHRQPGVDGSRIGVWARNGAAEPAMELFTGRPGDPAFFIAIQEAVDQDALTPEQAAAPADTPSLWFLVGGQDWSDRMRDSLETGKAVTRALQEPRRYDTRMDPDADIDRLKLMGPVYVHDALQWLGLGAAEDTDGG